MGEASQINEGAVGPPEKPVFNPKQQPILSKELVIEQAKKLWEKIVYLLGAGMKRNVIVQKPDGKEIVRIPLTLTLLLVLLSQFILLVIAAVFVAFFKWKVFLEEKKPPVETPTPSTASNAADAGSGSTTPPSSSPSQTPSPAAPTNPSGYSEPTLPPMPT